jgi:hypothetical protein
MSKATKMPLQPDGMPQGRHVTYAKGGKAAEVSCMCGGCHPNAQAAKGKTIYIKSK